MKDGVIPSNLHSPENPPPVCVPAKRKDTYLESWLRYFGTGTTWNKTQRPTIISPAGANILLMIVVYSSVGIGSLYLILKLLMRFVA
mmetsp:Transcript_25099/g.35168  ORF Transcript_25099/g.35168 Transcript_25099/m.35168 type:complete len:87 (-) Transcript_25099:117-377(-)